MQKTYLIFILLWAFTINSLNAKPISEQMAQQVAVNFYTTKVVPQSSKSISTSLVHREEAVTLNNEIIKVPIALYYVFNIDNEGFVVVSGDDKLIPIIAYSNEGNFSQERMPIHVAKWFQQYKNEIKYVLENGIQATNDIKQKWNKLISGDTNETKQLLPSVNPLLATRWNQAPYYNSYCPGGSVTGCVATAMAQIMKFWNHPQQGTGYHSYIESDYGTLSANFGATTYNWGSMPNTLNSYNDAVATLMYHCGVSVDMNYSPEVSGAYVLEEYSNNNPESTSEYALKAYFGYSPNLEGVFRANYTASGWINVMKEELNAGRPILHAGFGSGGGHAFVCDGYDNNNYFHFNWGWGGNSDGYYWNNALNPGSLGTGGGDGGYNSDQQIIIGVQPSSGTGTQSTRIDLYSDITVSPDPIQWGEEFTVNADIVNNGTTTFYGEITAALFDDSGNFIDYIKTFTVSNGLLPNYHYTGGLDFTNSGLDAAPGDYYVGIYVKPDNEWYAVGKGDYSNFIPIKIVYENDIELYADIVPSSNPLIQNQSASFTLDVANYGANDFFGDFSIDVHDLEGNWMESLDEFTEKSLCANCHYQNGLTFSTSNLGLEPGSYLLATWQKPDGGDWDLVGSTFFNNPIIITVAAPQLSPDIYENNNTTSSAYNLTPTFSANSANLKTTNSNNHVGNDYDYYKVSLPTGYIYTLTPRVHDSYDSGNGQSYTNDVLFSYNASGSWSDIYDDVINGSLTVSGGKTVYFHVAPYFQGQIGTYLLEIQIQRTVVTAIDDIWKNSDISLFPNPTTSYLSLKSEASQIEEISLFDSAGKLLFKKEDETTIDVSNMLEGSYIILVKTNKGIVRKKFIKISN